MDHDFDRECDAILTLVVRLERRGAILEQFFSDCPFHFRITDVDVRHMQCKQLFSGIAELDPGAFVGVDDAQRCGIDHMYLVRGAVDQDAKELYLLLGADALGDVLHCADRAQRPAQFVEGRMALLMDVLDAAVLHQQPVLDFVGRMLPDGAPQTLMECIPVIGMHNIEKGLKGRDERRGIALEDVEGLDRPADFVGLIVQFPTAHVGDALRLGEMGIATLHHFFRALALGDIGTDTDQIRARRNDRCHR